MIFPKIRVLHNHGRQAIPDLDAVELTPEFRGRPVLTSTDDLAELEQAAAICPTGAITTAPFTLDLGRCVFCGECARRAPRNIRFTNDYRIGSPTREGLVMHPGQERVEFDPAAVRPEVRRCFGRALQLREVSAGGDASVEMELGATGNVNFDFGRYGVGFTASPRHADGVVVSGPITANMAEALEICYEAVAEPKIVVACGTVSANALTELTAENDLPIFGVVESAAQAAAQLTKNGRVGLIGTQASIRSGAYERALERLRPGIRVTARACPLLVPLVENGRFRPGDIVAETVAAEYLAPVKAAGVDTLILGCTHYPLLREIVGAYMGPEVALVDVGEQCARWVKRQLELDGLRNHCPGAGRRRYYVSDSTGDFSALASIFLGEDVAGEVEQIDITAY